jgi:hypothetical protein
LTPAKRGSSSQVSDAAAMLMCVNTC